MRGAEHGANDAQRARHASVREVTQNEISAAESSEDTALRAAGVSVSSPAAVPPPPAYCSVHAHKTLPAAERSRRYDALHAGLRAGLSIAEIARRLGVVAEEFRRWIERERENTARAAKEATFKRRECKRCKALFLSEHAGHRHCVDCRAWLSEASDSPYTPDPGGSRGKQVRAVRS